MVLASMCGSRASNGYGSGGTVNATGFSSDCEFEMGFFISASNKPGTAHSNQSCANDASASDELAAIDGSPPDALTRLRGRADYTATSPVRVNLRSRAPKIKL